MAQANYTGSCQCGAVRFEVDVDLDGAVTCNCSRCRRLGSVLAFTTPENFVLMAGADATSSYRFNHHVIDHRFCNTCGIQSYALGQTPDGQEMVAINANCLDGIDPRALTAHHFDGASL
ncbi:GFA family protein [Rhodobacterales bacterium HKCCE2091]|nr:GFA family protein [Rhodobacterales bacterium HKCCE2091]